AGTAIRIGATSSAQVMRSKGWRPERNKRTTPMPNRTSGSRPARIIAGRAPSSASPIRLPQPLPEVVPPRGGQRRMLGRACEELLVRRVGGVQCDDVRDGETAPVPGDEVDRVTRTRVALSLDGEIEPAPPALQEALHDVGPSEADAELVARHARLRDYQLDGSDAVKSAKAAVGHTESKPREGVCDS